MTISMRGILYIMLWLIHLHVSHLADALIQSNLVVSVHISILPHHGNRTHNYGMSSAMFYQQTHTTISGAHYVMVRTKTTNQIWYRPSIHSNITVSREFFHAGKAILRCATVENAFNTVYWELYIRNGTAITSLRVKSPIPIWTSKPIHTKLIWKDE